VRGSEPGAGDLEGEQSQAEGAAGPTVVEAVDPSREEDLEEDPTAGGGDGCGEG
jgi:hypothetical protein